MDKKKLEDKLILILNDEFLKTEKEDITRQYIRKQVTDTDYSLKQSTAISVLDLLTDSLEKRDNPAFLVKHPEQYELDFHNLDLLLKLYQTISYDENNKKFFIDFLKTQCLPGHQFSPMAYLAFEFLYRIQGLQEAIEFLNDCSSEPWGELWTDSKILSVLSEIVEYEYPNFSTEDLNLIGEAIRKVQQLLSKREVGIRVRICRGIEEKIHNIKYMHLEAELGEGINLQINQDREKVKEFITDFGLSSELNMALEKIDEYYWRPTSDEFDYSAAIGKLREFLSKLIEEICGKIQEVTQDYYKEYEGKTPIAKQRKYIKKHLKLEKENKLLDGLVDVINSTGSHHLISEKEYFRLTKNMTIEISLLLFTKLNKFLIKHFH